MRSPLEPHERPNRSRLEKWRGEITEMRSLDWPFRKISEWLLEEHGFQISREAVRQFCKCRGISSKQSLPVVKEKPPVRRVIKRREKPALKFDYDETKPIEVDWNQAEQKRNKS